MHENAKLPPSPAAPRPVPCPECGAKLSAVDFVFRAGTVSNVGSCSGCDKYFDINQDEGRPILVDEYGRSWTWDYGSVSWHPDNSDEVPY